MHDKDLQNKNKTTKTTQRIGLCRRRVSVGHKSDFY